MVYVPGAVATHYEYAALEGHSSRYLRYYHRNRLRFVLKHCEPERIVETFVPAEMDWLKTDASPNERMILPHAYLASILAYPSVYLDAWAKQSDGEADEVEIVIEILADLRDQVWSR